MYRLISQFLSWIDPAIMPSLQEVDKVLKIISKEEKKQNKQRDTLRYRPKKRLWRARKS